MKILVSIFVLMIAIATLAQAEEPCRSVADACVEAAQTVENGCSWHVPNGTLFFGKRVYRCVRGPVYCKNDSGMTDYVQALRWAPQTNSMPCR
jgi:hypothetical protein